jgi:tripartite-type tricarboxylate transporter receptor subunit TctC
MKRFLSLLAAALALAASPFASAQQPAAYPSQPVKWIVPYVAGGGTDNLARALAEAMQPSLGQPLIIDNRPGASTNIGVSVLMQAKPDGYTIMQAENAALLFNEHMFAKLPYKPATDFTYIGAIGRFPVALVVHPDFPAKNVAELVRYVKANPEKVSYASPGNGSPHHMAMELFKQKAGISITHVPYKGAAPAVTGLLSGEVQVAMIDLLPALPHLANGGLKVLAVASPVRAAQVPDAPTTKELGLPGVVMDTTYGVIAPPGITAEVQKKFRDAVVAAMQSADIKEQLLKQGAVAITSTPQEYKSQMQAEFEKWQRVVSKGKITLE